VLVIERDAARVKLLADDLEDSLLEGDCCEVSTLDRAGIARADLVIAVTGDDEDNLVTCSIARRRGAGRMIARINDPRNEVLFQRLGFETTVSATQAILAQIEVELPTSDVVPLLQLRSGLEIVEMRLPANSPAAGRAIKQVMLPSESLIALVVDPAGAPRIPAGDTVLNAGDALVLVTRKDGVDKLREALVGATHGLDT
jgi:trk system potassium uptake protein TrkA